METSPPTTGMARVAHADACAWYAREALAKGRFGTAADWFRQAVAADPLAVNYRVDLAVKALLPMGNRSDARIEAERATLIEPTYADAWRALAAIEYDLGNAAACVAAYDKQMELKPGDPMAILDRCTIAIDLADYATVDRLCCAVLDLPDLDKQVRANTFHCLAMVHYRQGYHANAIELYKRAIDEGCYDKPLATWNMSLAMQSVGRYKEGWPAHEARANQRANPAMAIPLRRFVQPMLPEMRVTFDDQTKLPFSTEERRVKIHVHEEMGYGDTIALARYVALLSQFPGLDVRFEVRKPLVKLMHRSLPNVKVVEKAVDYPGSMGLEVFDYHVPMLSLPYIYRTEIDSVPWFGAYLLEDPTLREVYSQSIQEAEGPARGFRVGICWSSGIRDGIWLKEYGKRKSLHIQQMLPILYNNCTFVSLQCGPEREQLQDLKAGDYHVVCPSDDKFLDLLPEGLPDWSETAALISCLDLVITADTAVAHLAGAMGKEVWLMMHTEGSWHWMVDRSDSPWYPGTKIYRQRRPHDWTSVVENIKRDLRRLTK